jgi:hypothetical protein
LLTKVESTRRYRNSPAIQTQEQLPMNNILKNKLNTLIEKYGVTAVLLELAQIIEDGESADFDLIQHPSDVADALRVAAD